VYEETLEDNGRFNEQPVLPFNAYGTIAMARSEFEANDGSSQIFFLLKVLDATLQREHCCTLHLGAFVRLSTDISLWCRQVMGSQNLSTTTRSSVHVHSSHGHGGL
jgi:cyclophilin family peptidyl-prolyl cis-trans isomerase